MSEPHLCPRCPGVGLFVGEARGLHPRACGACGGVWLPPDEAARILRPLFTLGGLPGKPSPLRCPNCASVMTEWTVGATDIALDSCAAPELVTTLRDEAVYVLDARTGALRWQFHAGGRIEAAPVAVDSDGDGRKELVIAGHDRVLQVLRTPARRGNSPQ